VYRALIDSSESSRKSAYIRLAQLLEVHGKTVEVETVLLTAYKTLNDPGFAVLLCGFYRRSSELQKAFELMVDTSSSFPTHGTVWVEFGESLLAKREPKRALDAYQRAVSLNPDNPWFYHGLTGAHEACGDTPKVFEARQQLINLNPPASPIRSLDQALGLLPTNTARGGES
jgi:predicted Zn-dependent protease